MRAAAAQISRQRFFDLAVAGLGIFIEQSFGGHDHAVDAVAALHGLLIDEGLLDFVHFLGGAQTFESGDGLVLGSADLSNTGADGIAVDDDGGVQGPYGRLGGARQAFGQRHRVPRHQADRVRRSQREPDGGGLP